MKRGRRSAQERAGERLLELWQRRPEYGEPIGCVATTYTFDAAHFEEHCLARFIGMENDAAEDARGYLIEREERLSQVFAGVLVDQVHVPASRSLRWQVLPVRVDGGGCLHAKISLLAWEHRVRVIVASANLTVPGYRRNFENAACLDFTPEGVTPKPFLDDVIAALDDIRARAPGHDLSEGPQPALDEFLRAVAARVGSWKSPEPKRGEPTVSFVSVGPGRPSLFAQLAQRWPWGPADRAWVLSPFFDERDGALSTMGGLETLLKQRGDRTIHFVASGQRLPDGIVQLDLPECLRSAASRAERCFYLVETESDDGLRPLHAKSLWIERENRALFSVGSSNFTRAGTGHRDHGPINIEANVAYLLTDIADDFGQVCARAYPPYEPVVIDDNVLFVVATESSDDAEVQMALPAAFGAALFRVRDGKGELDLELVDAPPDDARVSSDRGPVDLPAAGGYPHHVIVPWHDVRPPSHLIVHWGDHAAVWPVNVADAGALPPPEELRELTLDELVEVLMSARPAHEVISRIIARREERGRGRAVEVDPHRKVDTRHFLLRRMRRISAAFEELRARLERPLYTREALWWRLRGPLGPMALAHRIATEEPASAAFQLAELALTFRGLRLEPRGELSRDEVQAAVTAIIDDLRHLALSHPAPPNLAAYVESTFAEVSR